MSTTQSGVAPANAAVATPANSSPDSSLIQSFQDAYDAQNQNLGEPQVDNGPELANRDENEPEGEQQLEAEGQEQAPVREAKVKAPKEGETKEPAEEKNYDSLDHYLTETGLEPESFMSLPVKVRVDGTDQDVPLAEVVKGYQLASASYARMSEAAQERTKIAQETTKVRGALGVQIKQANSLLTLAQQQLVQDFNGLNWADIRAKDPGQYSALYTDFQARQTAIQKAMQDVAAAEQANAQASEQARQQAIPVERTRLLQALPEWKDPAKANAAFRSISELARKTGFTDAELNAVTDHRQFVILDMAARYAQLQAKTPSTLKRVRAAPVMAKPGTRQVKDPQGSSVNNARSAWAKSGFRDDNAAAAVFQALG